MRHLSECDRGARKTKVTCFRVSEPPNYQRCLTSSVSQKRFWQNWSSSHNLLEFPFLTQTREISNTLTRHPSPSQPPSPTPPPRSLALVPEKVVNEHDNGCYCVMSTGEFSVLKWQVFFRPIRRTAGSSQREVTDVFQIGISYLSLIASPQPAITEECRTPYLMIKLSALISRYVRGRF